MQTTKWGPSGWRLLNAIASNYPDEPTDFDKNLHKCFYCHLSNVLPCIYCRLSYRQFTCELPVKNWLKNKYTMQYYLYLIHNKVNDKLRKQGYLEKDNPPFSEVEHLFNGEKIYDDCGWDFLYAIIYNYPVNPKDVDKYNYRLFFSKIKFLLPYEPVRLLYEKYFDRDPIDNYLNNRDKLTRWFYSIHKKIVDELNDKNIQLPSYEETSQKYESFRASCTSSNSNSCRIPDKFPRNSPDKNTK